MISLLDKEDTVANEIQKNAFSKDKRCPNCKSENTQPTGLGHSVGAGQPMRDADLFQRQCQNCGFIFHSSVRD